MIIKLLPLDSVVKELYEGHSTFYEGDSGLDLFIIKDQVIKAGETAFINLGFKAAAYNNDNTPSSYLLLARSSIAKSPLRLSNSIGLIDAGYRGELIAAVDNIKTYDFTVKKGERYFQLVSFTGDKISFQIVDSLNKTTRNSGGFGSTNTLPHNFSPKVIKINCEDVSKASQDENINENIL
ncbi:deoxyuridine 5'-triphosphate nucleotidohydrolase family protein [Cryptosporidium serpentis]